jgi:predicted phosphoribosyltransferase
VRERPPFRDRADAGRALGALLQTYAGRTDVVVLGLPRGGVPVAAEVAAALGAPLDVFVVRKLGVPGHDELAMGAIASGGVQVLNKSVIAGLRIGDDVIRAVAAREGAELARRTRAYRGRDPGEGGAGAADPGAAGADVAGPDVTGKVVIVVDDGLATGSTMRAAVAALRAKGPRRIVAAVPVGAPSTCAELAAEADEVVCARMPRTFHAVGQWYEDFSPPTEGEIRELLAPAD